MENYNPTQGFDRPMVEAEKRQEIDEALRLEVDVIMRMELEELKFAVRRKRGLSLGFRKSLSMRKEGC